MKNNLPISQKAQSANKAKLTALLLVGTIFAMTAPDVFATTGADDFQAIYERLLGWTQGSLGKALSLTFLIIGLIVGLVRGSLIGSVICVGAALALVTMPSILNLIFTATI